MKIDPNEVQQPANQYVEAVNYQYTNFDYFKDACACAVCAVGFFVLIWISFAMDVITTGM
jgi:hypothetical protein